MFTNAFHQLSSEKKCLRASKGVYLSTEQETQELKDLKTKIFEIYNNSEKEILSVLDDMSEQEMCGTTIVYCNDIKRTLGHMKEDIKKLNSIY